MISSGRPNVSRLGVTNTARPPRLEHPDHLAQHSLGIRDVLERLDGDGRRERPVGERQPAHVGHVRLPLLTGERAGVEIDAHAFPRRQLAVGVPHAAAHVDHAAGREQGRAQPVRGHVTLEGRVEPARGRAHPLAGDHRRARLHVHGPPRPRYDLGSRECRGDGSEHHGRGEHARAPARDRSRGREPPAAGSRCTGRAGPGSEPTSPCSQPNTSWPPRQWLTRVTSRPRACSPAWRASAGRCTRWRGRSR